MLEYANLRSGTSLSDQRIANGDQRAARRADVVPGQRDGRALAARPRHGARATRSSHPRPPRAMRQIDPDLELVVCGSSSAQMPTFGTWERVVLEETYDDVDFISCHAYYEPLEGDYASFLASAVNMDGFIDSVVATADHVKAVRGQRQDDQHLVRRVERLVSVPLPGGRSDHRGGQWPVAPRLLEDSYSVVDAVVFGKSADLAHPPCRPRHRREPGPARERHRADHDRARRSGVAADHLLPVRGDLPPRARGDPGAEARLPDVRDEALSAQCRSWTPSPRAMRRAGRRRSSWSTAASTRR